MLIAAFVVAGILLLTLSLRGRADLSRFLRERTAIADGADLDAFKALARRNMRLALAYLVVGLAFMAMGVVLLVTRGSLGTLLLLGFTIPNWFLSKSTRESEARSRSLPSAPEFAAEYARVGESWLKRALPDF
jgi:hypothetical protein